MASEAHERDARGDEGRVSWLAQVRAHGVRGTMVLEALALGRTTMLVTGPWTRYEGEEINLELELEGHRIFVVALVQRAWWDGCAILRFGVTSPLGNDLLARHVRERRVTYGDSASIQGM